MTLSIEVPAELEATLKGIHDLGERVQTFLRHQASLESWRDARRDARIARLRETVFREARGLQEAGVSREVIGQRMLAACDRLRDDE